MTPEGELRVQGCFDGDYLNGGLAPEIVRLTSDNMALQKELLTKHVGVFVDPHWPDLARKFVQRAADLFDGGLKDIHACNWQAAAELHLLAFESELGIVFRKPATDEPDPF